MLACGAGEANTAIGKRIGLTGGVVALLRFYGSARTIPFQDDLRTWLGWSFVDYQLDPRDANRAQLKQATALLRGSLELLAG